MGIATKIIGKRMIIYNSSYDYESAGEYFDDSIKGKQNDSPEMNANSKRAFSTRSQQHYADLFNDKTIKSKEVVQKHQQNGISSPRGAGGGSSQDQD